MHLGDQAGQTGASVRAPQYYEEQGLAGSTSTTNATVLPYVDTPSDSIGVDAQRRSGSLC